MIFEDNNQPPNALIWKPEYIPPICNPNCIRGCDVLYGIIHWTMSNPGTQSFIPTIWNPVRQQAVFFIHALEMYFDRYGCRRVSPPPRRESQITVATKFFQIEGVIFAGIPWAWSIALEQFKGAPKPGSVRLLPKWKRTLRGLSLASPL